MSNGSNDNTSADTTAEVARRRDDDAFTDEAPRTNTLTRRSFSGVELAGENAATQALIAKARADVESRFIMAMRCPRNMHDVRQRMLNECKRPGFAKSAIYRIPRGGKTITGLTIRFAEVAARCFGNMPLEVQTIFDSDEQRLVRVTATDLETNVTWSRDITVQKTIERKELKRGQRAIRERSNSFGDRIYIVEATDDEVAFKEAALISKAARTAILRIIPGHLQDEAFALCEATQAKEDAQDPDGAKNRMVDAFAAIRVTVEDLEEFIGGSIDKMTRAEGVMLIGVYNAIMEEETTWKAQLAERLEGKLKPPARGTTAPAAATAAPARADKTPPAAATDKPAAAQQAAQAAKTTPASSSGKGTEAAKNKIAEKAAAKTAPAADAKPAAETNEQRLARIAADHRATAPAEEKPTMPQFGEPKLVEPDDFITQPCSMCSTPTQTRRDEPPPICEACAES